MPQNLSDTPSADIIVLTDDIRGQTGFAVNGRLVCYALAEDYHVVNAAIDGTDRTTATIRGREIDVVPVETGRKPSARDRQALGREGMQRLVEQADPDVVISLIDVQMCSYLATMNRPQRATIQLRDPGEDPDPQAIVNTTLDGLRDLDLSKSFEWVAQVPIDGDPIPDSWESFFAEVDYPVAMSKYGARVAREAFDIDITTIRHGVDRIGMNSNSTPPEGYDLPEETFIVGTVNRNQFRKQHPRLIEAWGKFYDRAGRPDDVRFDLHCDPEDDMGWDLKRYVSRWGLNEAMVPPRGKVSREKLLALYRDMDVFTSATGGEGFGLTTAEAMSQGTPVLITDYTTSEELLTDGEPTPRGSLIPPAVMYDEHPQFSAVPRALVDTDAFANTLLEYYEDRERCRREGENAREWVTDALAFEDIADQWHSFISETVLGDGQPESRPDTATADD